MLPDVACVVHRKLQELYDSLCFRGYIHSHFIKEVHQNLLQIANIIVLHQSMRPPPSNTPSTPGHQWPRSQNVQIAKIYLFLHNIIDNNCYVM